MSALPDAQIAQLAAAAGFQGEALAHMVAIVLRESRGDPTAIGDKNNPRKGCSSVGLSQINSCPGYGAGHPRHADNPAALLDPAENLRAAFTISKGGADFGPWTTYRPNIPTYAPFLARGKAAAAQVGSGGGYQKLGGIPIPGGNVIPTPGASGLDAIKLLVDPASWLRVATFLGGAVLGIIALTLFLGDTTVDLIDTVT